jgi:hypothetical protein
MVHRFVVSVFAAVMLAAAGASSTVAAQQQGLVNINLEDVTVQVPISVAANVCDVTVAVLAQDLQDGSADCTAISNATAEFAGGGNQGGQTKQEGLINVNIQDTTIQVPIAAAANICDVDVFVLVQNVLENGATQCDAHAGAGGISG